MELYNNKQKKGNKMKLTKKQAGEIIENNVYTYIRRWGLADWEGLEFPEIRATEGVPSDVIETEFSGSEMAWESFLHEHIGNVIRKT